MTDQERNDVSFIDTMAVVFLVVGMLLWLWTGDFRLAITGLGAAFVTAFLGAYMEARKEAKNGRNLH